MEDAVLLSGDDWLLDLGFGVRSLRKLFFQQRFDRAVLTDKLRRRPILNCRCLYREHSGHMMLFHNRKGLSFQVFLNLVLIHLLTGSPFGTVFLRCSPLGGSMLSDAL